MIFISDAGSNNPQANEDNLEFLRWAIDEARTWGADHCIMLGDWHDNRHSLGVGTMLASLDGMDLLNDNFEKVWWLPGNHDILNRNSRDAASIEFARWLPNIEIIRDPLIVDDCAFIPWLMPDEHKSLDLRDSRYVFAHLEVAGFFAQRQVDNARGAAQRHHRALQQAGHRFQRTFSHAPDGKERLLCWQCFPL